ncbi:zinc-binding dehydrogenase [Alicyclobacillus sp.]|uniref:zinc-binding dehydrogenase n=1 Tax=Alicyclobacillus sp. TaxID=61169 RepID=UPI0025C4B555|nr:zinc-binding dehydrogenase [Alicyclobacillus sp.]MCL6517922.1 zinc-binding dehydrogenase [Alicyclobacillus sp.]
MKAFIHHGEPGLAGVRLTDVPTPEPGPGQVRIRLKTAGLNRRDLRVTRLAKPGDPPVVLGSDGAGVIDRVGEHVQHLHPGDEVVVNPSLYWYENSPAPPAGHEILGSPTDGTFAEFIVLSAEQVEPKPTHLTWEEAGVLPLAALTAYRALFTRARIQSGQTVLIPGAGSGVATFLVQFAKAAGAEVIVTSRSAEKRRRAEALGADRTIPTESDWLAELRGERVDVVIDSVGAATFDQCLSVLRPGGTLVTFGATAGDEVRIDIRSFFYGQFNLLGTTMGSRDEFRAMLRFVTDRGIRPVVDKVYPLADAGEALRRLQDGEQFGKIGLRVE